MTLMQLAALSRKVVLLSYALLLGVLVLNWAIVYNGAHQFVLWVQLVPLLLLLPGVALRNARAHIWLCVLLLIFTAKATVQLLFSAPVWLTSLEAACIFCLFFSALYHVRWSERLKKLNPGKS